MELADKIIELRKKQGYSQEELANQLGVSRQSVSKWEAGQSTPELERLIEMADLFHVSLDELIRGQTTVSTNELDPITLRHTIRQAMGYEYKSKLHIGKIPLVHINFGYGYRVAKGIFAFGNIAIGACAIGGLSCGGIALGGLGLGLFVLAGLSAGFAALGGAAIGIFALGGFALGIYSFGGVALGAQLAVGGFAKGYVAIGAEAQGTHVLKVIESTTSSQIFEFIRQWNSQLPSWLIHLFSMFK
ncbi:MAG: helix-turn-helix domain-containing protein [Beduini sp.]|uniref:helix-turn-helix domain-containing protein n=1 Tax=Beduini sp. TaxID=1922300 RepID=UPI0011CA27EB